MVVIVIFRNPLLGLFGLGETAQSYARSMIYIYTVTGTLRTCNYMNNNIFRAGGEPVFGTVVEIFGLFFITIPATALCGLVFRLSFPVVFFMLYLDEFTRLGIFIWYMNSGKWVKPVTVTGQRSLAEFRKSRAPGKIPRSPI
jgi:Na+-driven multidrug efflux pump